MIFVTSLNFMAGDLEKSKFLRFCRSQNLRHLFTEAQLPVEILPIIATFEKRYKVNIRGTLLDDAGSYGIEQRIKLGGKHQPDIDGSHIACIRDYLSSNDNNTGIKEFIPSRAVVLQHVERNGRRYQSGGNPNGLIIFSSPDTTPKAGQIVLIFLYSSHTFVIIRPFRELEASYRPFDFTLGLAEAAGYLSSAEVESALILVPFTKILSHFASISVGTEPPLLHVLPI